jgi:hypothetical protein
MLERRTGLDPGTQKRQSQYTTRLIVGKGAELKLILRLTAS